MTSDKGTIWESRPEENFAWRLSASMIEKLNTCPQSFYWQVIVPAVSGTEREKLNTPAIALGNAVQDGIQYALLDESDEWFSSGMLRLLVAYNCDLNDTAKDKCLGDAMHAFEVCNLIEEAKAEGWRVVQRELAFDLALSEETTYYGHIDLVLGRGEGASQEIKVVEIKTTSLASTLHFLNSPQVVGYFAAASSLFPEAKSVSAEYWVYNTAAKTWNSFSANTSKRRVLETLFDITDSFSRLTKYVIECHFPRSKNGCWVFGRDCPSAVACSANKIDENVCIKYSRGEYIDAELRGTVQRGEQLTTTGKIPLQQLLNFLQTTYGEEQ